MRKIHHLLFGARRSIERQWTIEPQTTQLPKRVIATVLITCTLPFCLNQLGFDFGSPRPGIDVDRLVGLDRNQIMDALHYTLAGSFTHTILEWSAFCTAIFTVILAFSYFNIKHDVTTPIIGVVLLCAGCMDAFHTLAADRLIEATADNHNLIPFTWALCRMCDALLTMVGVSLFLLVKPARWEGSTTFVIGITVCFAAIAYSIVHLCATSQTLPQTMYPDSLITRPWDVIPLMLFIVAGVLIYPRFYRRYPSLFSHALIISTIPNGVTQLHMAFGSEALFDNDFNIAHFLKIIAYLVPLAGLILDYTNTHCEITLVNENLSQEISDRTRIQQELQDSEARQREKSEQLEQALQDLQRAQFRLIQSEKMLSLGQLVAGVAHEINNPVSFIHGNIHYAEQYIRDLLELLQLYETQALAANGEIQTKVAEIDLAFIQSDLPRLISSMRTGTERIREIVLLLRNFCRVDGTEIQQVNIHEGIDNALLLLRSRLRGKPGQPTITVIKEYGNLPKVECYVGQLNQVFMNILTNAVDVLEEQASGSRGQGSGKHNLEPDPWNLTPTITIRTEVLEPNRVAIYMADNGPGMTEGIAQQLFDPFFTTKPVGKGTGMGLSISYQIVTAWHDGSLQCISAPGNGAEFVIELPIKHERRSQPV
ncbi:MAG: histidine kinase [Leptolyngbyaceae cyanobacterium RU_5_1]|nr:histidine kinase [Leptolyngbyaceae cyanobacterium RU_5_1]